MLIVVHPVGGYWIVILFASGDGAGSLVVLILLDIVYVVFVVIFGIGFVRQISKIQG